MCPNLVDSVNSIPNFTNYLFSPFCELLAVLIDWDGIDGIPGDKLLEMSNCWNRRLLEDLESLKETFIWSGDGSESEEPTTVVVPQSREVFQQQEMTVLDKFFSLRYGLAQKEATRLMGYSELSNSDGLGRRSTKTPTNLPEQRGMRITQFRNPSARSRELNQVKSLRRNSYSLLLFYFFNFFGF